MLKYIGFGRNPLYDIEDKYTPLIPFDLLDVYMFKDEEFGEKVKNDSEIYLDDEDHAKNIKIIVPPVSQQILRDNEDLFFEDIESRDQNSKCDDNFKLA
jgi:hypothetical protein